MPDTLGQILYVLFALAMAACAFAPLLVRDERP